MAPIGRSLHIGVNRLDPSHYGAVAALDGPENDAAFMASIARARDFSDVRIVLTSAATAERVIDEIIDAAHTLEAGSLFLLTFAGHGIQFPNKDRLVDDLERNDQTWCTVDRALLDDELRLRCLPEFAPGVQVVAVVDACHSGTTLQVLENEAKNWRMRYVGDAISKATYDNKVYAEIRAGLAPFRERKSTAAFVSLGACRDDQKTPDGKPHGGFTQILKNVWDSGRFNSSYDVFWAQVRSIANSTLGTEPTLCCDQPLPSLWQSPAFSIPTALIALPLPTNPTPPPQ